MSDAPLVTLEEIREAAEQLPPQVVHTPLLRSEELGAITGGEVWLKAENLQVTGSYKARATFTVLNRLPADVRQTGAALSSSGNFAGAWGYMGRLLGIPTTVVMPSVTSPLKIERTRGYGAEVVLCEGYDARWPTLFGLEAERGIRAVNTFEEPDVIRGHGTLGFEMVGDLPDVGTVLVPVSSGGLIAGVATAVKELRPRARVIGVQPAGSTAAYQSFRAREVVRTAKVETLCDALVASAPGKLPLAHILRYVDDVVVVPEEAVPAAVRWLAVQAKLVAEAGGAVCVAALLSGLVRPSGKTIALVSGGNIHPDTLAKYLREK